MEGRYMVSCDPETAAKPDADIYGWGALLIFFVILGAFLSFIAWKWRKTRAEAAGDNTPVPPGGSGSSSSKYDLDGSWLRQSMPGRYVQHPCGSVTFASVLAKSEPEVLAPNHQVVSLQSGGEAFVSRSGLAEARHPDDTGGENMVETDTHVVNFDDHVLYHDVGHVVEHVAEMNVLPVADIQDTQEDHKTGSRAEDDRSLCLGEVGGGGGDVYKMR